MRSTPFFACLFVLILILGACREGTAVKSTKNSSSSSLVKAVLVNGDSLHYIDLGKGEPIIFVHGTLGDYRSWGTLIDTFALDHRVISYSRRYAYPNRQIINDSADYSVKPHAEDLSELIQALDLKSVHLVGHSYGAYTALLTALNNPQLVKSLVLGEPPVLSLLQDLPGGDSLLNERYKTTFEPAAEAFSKNENERALAIFIGGVMGDSLTFSKIPKENQKMMLDNFLELRGSVMSNRSVRITADDLQKLRTPILLLKGDKSPLFLTMITDELQQILPNSHLITLSNSSHGLQNENPAEFTKAVFDFIDSH